MTDAVQHVKNGERKRKPLAEDASVAERLRMDEMSSQDAGFCKALILACAHASLIGGTAIITSTGPNLVFRENIQKYESFHRLSALKQFTDGTRMDKSP